MPKFLTLDLFTFTTVLLVSACASSLPEKVGAQTPIETPATPSEHNYRCESGETIAATYPSTDSATVQYKSTNYNMKIAVSGSGSRYVGDELEWWTKGSGPGSEGTLFRHMTDGTSGASLELCTEFQVQ
ncbi:MAG: MliC family protein [Pseudomonadales bacterium]|nr:MliC family protein [Pseudomonadales bacterium]